MHEKRTVNLIQTLAEEIWFRWLDPDASGPALRHSRENQNYSELQLPVVLSPSPASSWATAANMSMDIVSIKQELEYIKGSLLNYGKCLTMPPIIDSAFEHEHCGDSDAKINPLDNTLFSNLRDSIPGLRMFRESVKRDIELLDKVCYEVILFRKVYN